MARTLIPLNTIARAGIQPALTAGDDANEMYFVNDGRTFIYVLNTGGASNLTFITPGTVDTHAIANRTVAVAVHATGGMFIGPFPPSVWNNAGAAAEDNGTVHIDIDDDTTLTLGAFRLPA